MQRTGERVAPSPQEWRSAGWRHAGRSALIVGGGLVIALGARVTLPAPVGPVPLSLQTLALCLVAGWLGRVDGTLSAAGYLVLGALGAPVFADGAAGAGHLFGPTSGYLLGFLPAAWLCGLFTAGVLQRGPLPRRVGPEALRLLARLVAFLLAAHAVVLLCGATGLVISAGLEPRQAFRAGVAPFLWGAGLKSGVAALFLLALPARRPFESDSRSTDRAGLR